MRVSASLVRGGTSKCWLFDHRHVPATLDRLERLLVDAYGAKDPVHLDGVGGATPTTSKAAVVKPCPDEGVDVEYLFGQVGIGVDRVEWGSNCGNCATAIALWSVARGLVPVGGDLTRVVMRNTNTGALLEATVDTAGGLVPEFGTQTVPGTRSGGVAVGLTFLDPAGRTTGALLPTGNADEELRLAGEAVRVTMLDAGAPVVLVDAAAAGLTGAEPVAALRGEVGWLRAVRHAAAPRMGLLRAGEEPGDAVPKVGLVGAPVPYVSSTGDRVAASDYDVSVRMLTMNDPHPAIGLTSAVAVAAAHLVDGSVVRRVSTATADSQLRIGTPAGVVLVSATDIGPSGPHRVTVRRAARVLCDAEILVPEPALPTAA
ncbi:PrpF domain-containing protein [Streptomyces millisiae]|uniref:PrpF domain-containing protein n=1 Tax=Streptomyces millisiae TaxID=3075542 RepID=A0ABU2LMF2_9ACTN|nr:PrpF domain-containing protein [Streptomyces sp. DSM 44918]MDT0318780.1 PrpF domain-containing protein [Streptomyces sp. DSM 44918]